MTAAPGLSWQDVRKSFGGLAALKGVTLSMTPGSITAVIGPNGAGKTTLFNTATGLGIADAGTIRFGAADITRASAMRVARLGLTRTFQNLRMVEGATVWETVLAARSRSGRGRALQDFLLTPGYRRRRAADRDFLVGLLRDLDLLRFANQVCTTLSLLDQRKVELARALAAEPAFLLLDEPTAGATPAEADILGALIRRLPERGLSVGLIEHSVGFITTVADVAYVLNFGEIVASGPARTIAEEPVVHQVFAGSGFGARGGD
jgi:ABC-type branched-subunit amino acid transport system ATPase component